MIVNSTELQNNFGKYLALAAQQEIIITRNGHAIAKLSPYNLNKLGYEGIASYHADGSQVNESAVPFEKDGFRATYEEYLQLTKETETKYEYIDGVIYYLSSPKTKHQTALRELLVLFYNFFDGTSCSPMIAPYDIELHRPQGNINVVQPDLMVICDLEDKLSEDDYYKGVPKLVIEILSESTKRKDLIIKLDLYMSCGVEEYWTVNPENQEITIYKFADSDIKQSATFKKGEKAFSFIFSELMVKVDDVFS